MRRPDADAVVIGAGPNGLVAANALADAGWDVLVLESNDEVGGAVRSAEVTAPGYVTDLFSAFYPMAAASPVIRDLDLTAYGLQWRRAPSVMSHALDDGAVATIAASPEETAAGLEVFAPGDGDAWLRLVAEWRRVRDPLLDALFTPFPPVRAAARLLRRTGVAGTMDLARLGLTPVRRLAAEQFDGAGGALLLTGNAMHSDIGPDAAGSGMFGWLLSMIGQDVGFPVPRGGAGNLALALRRRAEARGVEVRTDARVVHIGTEGGRARTVRLVDGTTLRARRAVLADVSAPALYRQLLDAAAVPQAFLAQLDRFQWDHGTVKVNWALRTPVPWTAAGARGSGTVHLGVDLDGFVDVAADLVARRLPRRPYVLFGQMTTADPDRSPAGTESAWAYSHVPHGLRMTDDELAGQVERMEAAVERVAPGFGDTVVARHVQGPEDLEAADANLVGGAINGGTSGLHQQLVLRPTRGLGRAETPVRGLYLASAAAHPGGGVHGACGWNAAHAALVEHGGLGPARAALVRTAWSRLLRPWMH